MQPGSTITPGGQDTTPQPPAAPVATQPEAPVATQLTPSPAPEAANPNPEPLGQAAETTPEDTGASAASAPAPPTSNWEFTANDQESVGGEPYQFPSVDPISWTASEYVDHEKNRSWFFAIAGATLLIAAITFLITRDLISPVVIIIAGTLLAVSAARKPRTLNFQLDDHGLQVGSKFYEYALFKSFTVLEEGAFSSIQLLPARRFMPSLSIYYPPDQEEAIISCLGSFLPHEERKRDAVDSLMRRIKF